jgi:hypothetical protein
MLRVPPTIGVPVALTFSAGWTFFESPPEAEGLDVSVPVDVEVPVPVGLAGPDEDDELVQADKVRAAAARAATDRRVAFR